MIILNPNGGLCNRLRVIDSAIKLGTEYDDSVIVYWKTNAELGCAFEDLFEENTDYRLCKDKLIIKNTKDSDVELLWKMEEKIGHKRIYMDKTKANLDKFQEDYINAKGNDYFYLSTCYNFYDSPNKYGWILPKKELAEKIRCITQLFGKYCIGIHIRRTDHGISKMISRDELFIQKMEEEIGRDSNVNFYLATDDAETKRYFLEKFGDRIITNEGASLTRENIDGMQSAVIDLFALSKTQKIYGSYCSSFTDVASCIGNVKAEYVYAVPTELPGKRVVIYGAGSLGRIVYGMYCKLCDIVGWIDQNYQHVSGSGVSGHVSVEHPNKLLELDFDYIVIAVTRDDVRMEIEQLLLDMNISHNKIIKKV